MRKIRLKFSRLILVFLGIILTISLIELALFTISFAISGNSFNHIDIAEDYDIGIVVLGESTSEDGFANQIAWPELLEKELNSMHYNLSFKVYNLATAGFDTNDIVALASEYIPVIKPSIIISMIGVNDRVFQIDNRGRDMLLNLDSLRTFKLGELFYYGMKSNIRERSIEQYKTLNSERSNLIIYFSEKITSYLLELELNSYNREKKDYFISELIFNEPDQFDIKNFRMISHWLSDIGYCYYSEVAFEAFINFHPNDNSLLDELADCYLAISKFENEMEFFKYIANNYPFYDRVYEALGEIYERKGDYFNARAMFEIASIKRINNYPSVAKNYFKLYYLAKENDAQMLAMQYPTLDIYELNYLFEEFDDIIFVENKDNFEEAISEKGFEKVFVDRFAGVWGHTTTFGNSLIVENVLEKLVPHIENNVLNLKQKTYIPQN